MVSFHLVISNEVFLRLRYKEHLIQSAGWGVSSQLSPGLTGVGDVCHRAARPAKRCE